MKAIEFVRIVGVEKVKSILLEEGLSCFSAYLPGDSWPDPSTILVSDLREIVEAWELVERYGGLEGAKKLHYDEFRSDINWDNLQQAITLMEQCNAKS